MSRNETILTRLESFYYGAKPGLNFTNAFELLIATIMSAQTTDKQVNAVTETLFEKYPDAQSLCNIDIEELEELIKSTGFYRNKAANVKKTCCILISEHDGQVPQTMHDLLELPGVGRKTANVVLSNAFDIPAIAVDTHVFRVANRLGLANAKSVQLTERQLMENIPKSKWSDAHHWLIRHGRKVCLARSPKCQDCFLADVCKYIENQKGN